MVLLFNLEEIFYRYAVMVIKEKEINEMTKEIRNEGCRSGGSCSCGIFIAIKKTGLLFFVSFVSVEYYGSQ